MNRVRVRPALLRWAMDRSGFTRESLQRRFPKLELWERAEVSPTVKQLEAFAKATYTPFGYFFLSEPPVEQIPIPDLRTIGSRELDKASPDLLDTIYICQHRQTWYRDYARSAGEEPRSFVGSVTLAAPVEKVAA